MPFRQGDVVGRERCPVAGSTTATRRIQDRGRAEAASFPTTAASVLVRARAIQPKTITNAAPPAFSAFSVLTATEPLARTQPKPTSQSPSHLATQPPSRRAGGRHPATTAWCRSGAWQERLLRQRRRRAQSLPQPNAYYLPTLATGHEYTAPVCGGCCRESPSHFVAGAGSSCCKCRPIRARALETVAATAGRPLRGWHNGSCGSQCDCTRRVARPEAW